MGGLGFAVFPRFGGLNKHVLQKYGAKHLFKCKKAIIYKILLAAFMRNFVLFHWVIKKLGGSQVRGNRTQMHPAQKKKEDK